MTGRQTQSWDDFWAEVTPARTEVIRGITVTVPSDLPLAVEQRVNSLRDSDAIEDIGELLLLLFGVGLDEWRDAGMGLREVQTVLTWGIAQASGVDLSFADAYQAVLAGDSEGKPPAPPGANRATRRAASPSRSASTGGRSKPTSSASTGSARRTSRA